MGKTNYGFYLVGGGLAFVVGALSWIFVFAPEDDNKRANYAYNNLGRGSGSGSSTTSGSGNTSGYLASSEESTGPDRRSIGDRYSALNGGSRRKRKSRKNRKSRKHHK